MVAKKTGSATSGGGANESYTSNEAEHAECLTYFYPKKGWKGEFGFDWFRMGDKPDPQDIDSKGTKEAVNFDNIGVYVAPTASKVWMKAYYPDDGSEPSYFQSVDYDRGFLTRGEDIKTDSETKQSFGMESDTDIYFEEFDLAQFCVEQQKEKFCKYVVYKDGEYYFYLNVPFMNLWKMVTFDIIESDSQYKQHYFVIYTEDGKVKEFDVTHYTKRWFKDEYGDDDFEWESESIEFTNGKKEVLQKGNMKKYHLRKDIIDRIYRNEDMTTACLVDGDKRIKDVSVTSPTCKVTVQCSDHRKMVFEYEAGQLGYFHFTENNKAEKSFKGLQSRIIRDVKKAKLKVIEELLSNPFIYHPDQIRKMDNSVSEVTIEIKDCRAVKCKLQVEKETVHTTMMDREHSALMEYDYEELKLVGGKAKVPTRYDNKGKVVYEDVDFSGEFRELDAKLMPFWRLYMDRETNCITKRYEDKIVFYPVSALSLVDYAWRDKRNGLKNDEVTLQLKTVGKFKKVEFESQDKKVVDTAIGSGSTTKADDTIKLVAKSKDAGGLSKRIWAKDTKNDSVVGALDVFVFKPIHLKICFVNVIFFMTELQGPMFDQDQEEFSEGSSGLVPEGFGYRSTSKWNYKKDRFIEILGQAGIVFDEIDDSPVLGIAEQYAYKDGDKKLHSDLTFAEYRTIVGDDEPFFKAASKPEELRDVEYISACETWDDDFKEWAFDYKRTSDVYSNKFGSMNGVFNKPDGEGIGIDLNHYLDSKFLAENPQYAGYIRVYVLDKHMFEYNQSVLPRYITTLPSLSSAIQSPLVVFTKSIEDCDATESNPLACGLLRCLGLDLFSDPESMKDGTIGYQYGTTTNMMDNTEYRYSLNPWQWYLVRNCAKAWHDKLEQDEKNAKGKK